MTVVIGDNSHTENPCSVILTKIAFNSGAGMMQRVPYVSMKGPHLIRVDEVFANGKEAVCNWTASW